jgi:galactonate dehydratase
MAEFHHVPFTTHACGGPVNQFAAAHLCASAPNARIMETVRAFHRGFYPDIVQTKVDIRDGHLQLRSVPGLGTSLLPDVLRRPDAITQVSHWLEKPRIYPVAGSEQADAPPVLAIASSALS